MGSIVTKIVTAGVVLVATMVAKKATDGTWRFVTGKEAPNNPDDPDIDFKEAVIFTVLSGAVVAVLKMLANRETTRVLGKAQGKSKEQVAEEE